LDHTNGTDAIRNYEKYRAETWEHASDVLAETWPMESGVCLVGFTAAIDCGWNDLAVKP